MQCQLKAGFGLLCLILLYSLCQADGSPFLHTSDFPRVSGLFKVVIFMLCVSETEDCHSLRYVFVLCKVVVCYWTYK